MISNFKNIIRFFILALVSGCICVERNNAGLSSVKVLPLTQMAIQRELNAVIPSISKRSLFFLATKTNDKGMMVGFDKDDRSILIGIDKEKKIISIDIDLEASKGTFTPIESKGVEVPASCEKLNLGCYRTVLRFSFANMKDASNVILDVFLKFYDVPADKEMEFFETLRL